MFAIPDSSHRTCLIVGCQALALNPTNWKIKQVYLQEDVLVVRKYKFTKNGANKDYCYTGASKHLCVVSPTPFLVGHSVRFITSQFTIILPIFLFMRCASVLNMINLFCTISCYTKACHILFLCNNSS